MPNEADAETTAARLRLDVNILEVRAAPRGRREIIKVERDADGREAHAGVCRDLSEGSGEGHVQVTLKVRDGRDHRVGLILVDGEEVDQAVDLGSVGGRRAGADARERCRHRYEKNETGRPQAMR